MAQSIYKVWLTKPKDAYYTLSPEEREKMQRKGEEALKKVGAELVVGCYSVWSSENWMGFGVEKFPDLDAVQKHTRLLLEMDWHRYLESTSYLGTETP
jgi:hypothetical protein